MVPNPVRSDSKVQITNAKGGRLTLTLFDIKGRLITKRDFGDKAAGNMEIPLSDIISERSLSQGLYLLKIEWGAMTLVRRMICYTD